MSERQKVVVVDGHSFTIRALPGRVVRSARDKQRASDRLYRAERCWSDGDIVRLSDPLLAAGLTLDDDVFYDLETVLAAGVVSGPTGLSVDTKRALRRVILFHTDAPLRARGVTRGV
jgi:hypothetical protein